MKPVIELNLNFATRSLFLYVERTCCSKAGEINLVGKCEVIDEWKAPFIFKWYGSCGTTGKFGWHLLSFPENTYTFIENSTQNRLNYQTMKLGHLKPF